MTRGYPGMGSSVGAGGSWGPTEPQRKGKPQDGREAADLSRWGGSRASGWATKTSLVFLPTEHQETSSSLYLTSADAQGTAVL